MEGKKEIFFPPNHTQLFSLRHIHQRFISLAKRGLQVGKLIPVLGKKILRLRSITLNTVKTLFKDIFSLFIVLQITNRIKV